MKKQIYKKFSPENNLLSYEFEVTSSYDIGEICKKSKKAFNLWSKTNLHDRKKLLLNLLKTIRDNQKQIIDTIILDTAKPYCEAETEVIESCDIIEYFCNETFEGIDIPVKIEINNDIWPFKEAFDLYQPCGAFAVIKPWNYPFELSIWSIVPLIIAGNVIVFKPSELSTATGILMCKMMQEAGFPDGVFNIVLGDADVGKKLINDPNIDGVSFTGSSIVGEEIYRSCKKSNIKFSLEMGGSDFSIVLNDNLEEITIPGVLWGAFSNAGQVCVSIEKLLIDSTIYNDFIKNLVNETKKLKLGKDISPLISKKQYIHAQRIINMAIDHGARVLCGGANDSYNEFAEGYYFQPTIIECEDLRFLADIEEIFAPIIFVASFNNEETIVDIVNSSKYGLGCSIWTGDFSKHNELIKNINVGMIWINDVNLPMPQVPWFGRNRSGLGVNLSKDSVYDMMERKVIHIDNDTNKRDWWYPYI